MKISLNWIGEFVDLSGYSPEELMDLLTLHTTEVEGLAWFADEIQDVIVGEVISCIGHPDADKLSVTEVSFGGEGPVNVVCGAPNVRQGLKVAFAPLGASLPGGLKIKKAKLRGVQSIGMICSEKELELGDSHAGIMELPSDAPVGARLVDYLDLLDPVLEVDNKAINHRPDLWGHYGFAREFAAILKRDLAPISLFEDWPTDPSAVNVSVTEAEVCPFYSVTSFAVPVSSNSSPLAIQRRLLAVGQRPVGLVVDLTNYVLLETGQPTHAFDAKKVAGQQLHVRCAAAGESLITLDEEIRSLTPQDLVIADSSGPVALAGVMGGSGTQVDASTQEFLLEAASFSATQIRRTSHRFGLRSESSARFEKTLDVSLPVLAQARFAHLLLEHCPEAAITGAPVPVGDSTPEEIHLTMDVARVAERLGLSLSPEDMAQTLDRLGFPVTVQDGDLQVQVPSWRSSKDIRLPVDLEEEVGRLVGYDQIQPKPLTAPLEPTSLSQEQLLSRRLATCLVGSHCSYQTQGYSFLSSEALQKWGLSLEGYVPIQNPVHEGADLLRKDPLFSLCEQAVGNEREVSAGVLFEMGKGYSARMDSTGEPQERHWLGLVSWNLNTLGANHVKGSFRSLRGIMEDLLSRAGKNVALAEKTIPPLSPLGNPSRVLTWTSGPQETPVAQIFQIHPALRSDFGFVSQDVSLLLLDLGLLSQALDAPFLFQAPARFPAIKVDVSLALPKAVTFAETEAALRQAAGKFLSNLVLFDQFEGEGLPAGFKSLAFRATLRSSDKTLSEKEEKKYLKAASRIAEELGGHLRS